MEDYRNGGTGFGLWCEEFICLAIYEGDSPIANWTPIAKFSDEINPVTGRSWKDIWEEQKRVAEECLIMVDGKFIYRLIILCWMRGEGKSAVKGSKVLMYDGTVKNVEDVRIGDQLMGDDGTPRNVLQLGNGKEELWDVIPYRGEKMTVTKCHVLTLRDREYNRVHDMHLSDFMEQNKAFKRRQHLFRIPVDFPEQPLPIDPYFLGIWLGDGCSNGTSVVSMEPEVEQHMREYADHLGMIFKKRTTNSEKTYSFSINRGAGEQPNRLMDKLRKYNLLGNKHIPQIYKANSRENRLQLLAGLIDSDGYLNRNSFQIVQKRKTLSEDILFLARSLGFHAEINECTKTIKDRDFSGQYYTIGISGDCDQIPTKVARRKASPRKQTKPILESGIKEIKSAGIGEYFGFMLDGNHRYVTGDFTVTHNSLFACLIQLWKFFCFPRQQIMLGANSKDQVKFVHFDIMRDIILNSPRLLEIVGKRNVQEKEIRLRDRKGNIGSFIRSISSFSGIVSNVTGYTFSEMFDMKNPKFFVQIDGSIRNIPNALGVIDSTVSEKSHILYKLFKTWERNEDPHLFFSHRQSPDASYKDFWNPQMTQAQLDSYKAKFPDAEFARYFRNTWESGNKKMFSEALVEACHYIGVDGALGMHNTIVNRLEQRLARTNIYKQRYKGERPKHMKNEDDYLAGMMRVEDIYVLNDGSLHPKMASMGDLQRLGKIYNTDWAILCGVDRADPLKIDKMAGAKTIVTIVAKGLPNSKSNPEIYYEDSEIQKYIYFMLHFKHVESNELDHIKEVIKSAIIEFDGIDSLCSERWGMWDVGKWCETNEIIFTPLSPTYEVQRMMFTELFTLFKTGLFKTPTICVPGAKDEDLFVEEATMFDHNPYKNAYGSPQKNEKYGVQDDAMFSLGHCIYGGKMLGLDDFRPRVDEVFFGEMHQPKGNTGVY